MSDHTTVFSPGEVIEFAVEALENRTQVAARLGISTSALDKWQRSGIIPGKYGCPLAEITNLGPWQICPEVFDPKYAVSKRELRLVQAIRDAEVRTGEDLTRTFYEEAKIL